ncbi:aminotransferase [Rhizorhabdus dicambivorans]|uniref:aspartate transaminase n=1 Tax=Rhizorhabdus dicambivorans TaxID=1850238 RepID=A0A2A4FQG4_9SPHN|nr:aminotransferase [Rhizorhabdus dicambivorans]ATE65653.1 pyridoxal phosphate-dependent aminotransferase [Rhizorhabdus dicambivorans]PCE40995.1 pyridoxal phosphate-dependent aminotransferase [Rhizorhabdus dicambivorans]
MNPIYAALPTTIFEKMSAIARETGAINLGQGFPDAPGPEDVRRAAADALIERSNQYPPMLGIPELRQAVAAHYGAHHGLSLDWQTEVVATSGATEAISAAILGLVSPGDEVVLIQPLYDAYMPMVRRAGGVPKLIGLEPPHWTLSADALDAAITPATKLLIFNNPANPTGKMYDRATLEMIAKRCIRHDLVAICDEVWEHVVFDGDHVPLIAIPGMRDRTVKIGSAGKIFALTGWKVGWMVAGEMLAKQVGKAHQFMTFTTPPNLQWAVAQGLAKPQGWFEAMRAGFARSRDRLVAGLEAAGYAVLPSQATWFVSVDLAASGIALDDVTFADRMALEGGVVTIPVSAFFEERPVTNILRLCYCKEDAVLDEAIARLKAMREKLAI